jgi:hypothetical protein
MILDTPPAERTMPATIAAVPRMKSASVAFAKPAPGPIIVKEMIEKMGGNADARNFFQGGVDEMEAIVRKRIGKENASTVKNPSAHNVVFETTVPAIAPSGNATMSKNHDRLSSPMSRRKLRTLSP